MGVGRASEFGGTAELGGIRKLIPRWDSESTRDVYMRELVVLEFGVVVVLVGLGDRGSWLPSLRSV